MRYAPILLLAGCVTLEVPVWHGDAGVAELCEMDGVQSYTHRGVTMDFDINVVDDVTPYCPASHTGCIWGGYTIYAREGFNCPKTMAHELSHGFGVNVDRPKIRGGW